ncbi:nucleoside diphosphate kinase 6-like isoform X2 [Biomphalaria glabrata]|uniref:Nucleoside diphosphate kinase n=1 Tax=Biomphalaria glabrata TaxID=6526 RepID=A0A9W3AGH7_BIOGL|nr:nucleoside diphosphate kinase 6-like isoform X2 [Biomphalaria glabrata]
MTSFKTLQLTLALIKPDIVAHPHILNNVTRMILENGFYVIESKRLILTTSQAEQFYAEHKGKFFQNRLVSFMSSGPLWTYILCGDNAISRWRKLMGPTKVLKTVYDEPLSIRGLYGLTDTRNCTHGSDSEENAEREIQFFFPEFNIKKWYETEHDFFRQDFVEFDHDKLKHVICS